jgi:hypothetical protein
MVGYSYIFPATTSRDSRMDNEHIDKLLVAMVKLTDAIEQLNQRLPRAVGIECFPDGSTRQIFSNERHPGGGGFGVPQK